MKCSLFIPEELCSPNYRKAGRLFALQSSDALRWCLNDRGRYHQKGAKLAGAIIFVEINLLWGYCPQREQRSRVLYFRLERAGATVDHVYTDVLAPFGVKGSPLLVTGCAHAHCACTRRLELGGVGIHVTVRYTRYRLYTRCTPLAHYWNGRAQRSICCSSRSESM